MAPLLPFPNELGDTLALDEVELPDEEAPDDPEVTNELGAGTVSETGMLVVELPE